MPAKVTRAETTVAETTIERLEEPPENWPSDIIYLTDHSYSTAVTPEQRIALSRPAPDSDQWSRVAKPLIDGTTNNVKIVIINNEKHPAYQQRGLFARRKLDPDSFITLYLGHVHTNSLADTDPHSDYDLALDRELGLSVDAAKSGNIARFANDYRGIADRPNAEFRDCFIKIPCTKRAGGTKWERRVGIFVLPAGKAGKRKVGIREDEEVLVSYGKSYWESRKLMATFRKDFEMLRIAKAALDE